MSGEPRQGKPRRRKTTKDTGVGLEIRRARTRLRFLAVAGVLGFVALGARLTDLAVLSSTGPVTDRHVASPEDNQTRRADITDRNGRLIATDYPKISVFADPKEVSDPGETASALAEVLPNLDAEKLGQRLSRQNARFVWVKRHISDDQQRKIMRLGLPGVQFRTEYHRVYPQRSLTSHVVGYVGVENQGLAGIERSFEARLTEGYYDGPLQLTLDLGVQAAVRDELKQAVERFQAKGGSGLVMEAGSGVLLAAVSLPDFDPNHYQRADKTARFNRNTQGSYELGSLFKVLTAGMALDSNAVEITDQFDAVKPFKMHRYRIKDFHAKKRRLSMAEVIAFSSNIGAAQMAMAIGTEAQTEYFRRFGLLERHPIRLNEVSRPQRPKVWREINTVTASYGHGIAVSPLQAIDAVASAVCGGPRRPAYLSAEAGMETPLRPAAVRDETAAMLRWLMWLVVAEGSGTNGQVPGYLIGGKTGSADKAGPKGYGDKRLLSSFIGAFPIDDPRYLVLVTLDEPKGDEETHNQAHGGWTAAPTVAKIVSRSGPILGLAPAELAAERWFKDRLLVGEAFNGRLKRTEPSFAAVGDGGWALPSMPSRSGGEECSCGVCLTPG
ncbi:MAG: penicillin-binding protein 2 [Alphaproteobacteria bacterium]|nr:penicillin-binding protein 2 [Alphaproteobacteria bacterium]